MADEELTIGKVYTSWSVFIDEFEQYQKRVGAVFVTRDCKTFGVEGDIVERYKYRYAVFECKQGKKHHASTATKRLNQRSFKTGCQVQCLLCTARTSACKFHSWNCPTIMRSTATPGLFTQRDRIYRKTVCLLPTTEYHLKAMLE